MKRPDVNLLEDASSGTSSGLVRDVQANDQDAWRRLVTLYSRRMYRWCRVAGLQPADAGNVVQEALHSVVRHVGEFRREQPGDTFGGWLRRITDNKIRDHFRRTGRALDIPAGGTGAWQKLMNVSEVDSSESVNALKASSAEVGDDASEATWDTTRRFTSRRRIDFEQRVAEARRDISPRDWLFFWRVAVDGQSAAEVGREFGVSSNAVRLVKMRVLRRLRRCLESSPTEYEAAQSSASSAAE